MPQPERPEPFITRVPLLGLKEYLDNYVFSAVCNFEPRRLQHEYKHAPDFGITGGWVVLFCKGQRKTIALVMQSPFFFWLVGYIRGWSSRLPRYDFLAFSRMIMFFSLTLIFSVLTCCWAFQYNSLIRSPFLPQNAFCLALPFHTPPTCLYTPWRTAYIPLVMNPRVVWLRPVNALRYYIRWFLWFEHRAQSRPIVCFFYDPQTTTTHPFEPSASMIAFGTTSACCSTCLIIFVHIVLEPACWHTYCSDYSG